MARSAGTQRAAVLVLLRKAANGNEVLLMRRSERPDDPWSGQLSFPGGHEDPGDADLMETALREAREEVGLDGSCLDGKPRYVGERAPANRSDLIVSVYLAVLKDGGKATISPGPEASNVHWVAICNLTRVSKVVKLPNGRGDLRVDGFSCGDLFIWGMTFRILDDLLSGRAAVHLD